MTNNYFDSQDLTQDTFLSAYKNINKFDGSHEKAWLSRIATNKCLDYIKQKARNTVATEDTFFQEIPDTAPTTEGTVMELSIKAELLSHCNQLSPPYDEVARYYFYNEFSIKDISFILNRNEKTVKTQVYRAKAMLQKCYKGFKKGGILNGRTYRSG